MASLPPCTPYALKVDALLRAVLFSPKPSARLLEREQGKAEEAVRITALAALVAVVAAV